jgi:hypothetical protein
VPGPPLAARVGNAASASSPTRVAWEAVRDDSRILIANEVGATTETEMKRKKHGVEGAAGDAGGAGGGHRCRVRVALLQVAAAWVNADLGDDQRR